MQGTQQVCPVFDVQVAVATYNLIIYLFTFLSRWKPATVAGNIFPSSPLLDCTARTYQGCLQIKHSMDYIVWLLSRVCTDNVHHWTIMRPLSLQHMACTNPCLI